MKKLSWIIALLFAAIIGYLAAGPYLTIAELKTAVADKDAEKLSANVDFPALRQNLKYQLKASMMKDTTDKLEENPFAALAAGLASKVVDGLVDFFVTPAALASYMEGKRPSRTKSDTPLSGGAKNKEPSRRDDLFKNARYTYDSLSQFSIWVPNDAGGETRFVLQRNGLTWKLVNLIIPTNAP